MPFNSDGDLIFIVRNDSDVAEWRENTTFEDTMRVVGTERGCTTSHVLLQSDRTAKIFAMCLRDLAMLIKAAKIDRGVVSGTWKFVQFGRCYGIKWVPQKKKK